MTKTVPGFWGIYYLFEIQEQFILFDVLLIYSRPKINVHFLTSYLTKRDITLCIVNL